MTNEEIVLLYQKDGNKKDCLEKLFEQNKGFIYKIAKRYSGYCELEDLIQEGFLGLARAAENYDESKGASFITCAYPYVRAVIHRYVAECCNSVSIPEGRLEEIRNLNCMIDKFVKEYGKKPDVSDLSQIMKKSEAKIRQLLSDALCLTVKSLDAPISEEDEYTTLGDMIKDPDNSIENYEDKLQNEQLKSVIWAIVDELEPLQKDVICERFKNKESADRIADMMELTPEKVYKLEYKAIKEMRQHRYKKRLAPFFSDNAIYSMSISCGTRHYFMNTWTSAPERAVIMAEEKQDMRGID